MSPRQQEKRKVQRIQPFVSACRIVDGGRRFAGYLTDLSLEGARVSSAEPLPSVGSDVTLETNLSRRAAALRLRARVIWCRQGEPFSFFGLTFPSLDSAQQRALEAVVEEFRRRAADLLKA